MTTTPWHVMVLTLFPDMFPGPLGASLPGAALARGIWSLETLHLRDFADAKYNKVDDTPFGGGPGMVFRPDVVANAIDTACANHAMLPVLCPSPRGRSLTQARIRALAEEDGAIIVCGRYEGIDARVLESREVEEVCIGDFILAGGEIPAMMLIEAVVRLLPGALGNNASVKEESFSAGLLEYPQYTRPTEWEGRRVPDLLRSGRHDDIATWRRKMAERTTKDRRPDLWAAYKAHYRTN